MKQGETIALKFDFGNDILSQAKDIVFSFAKSKKGKILLQKRLSDAKIKDGLVYIYLTQAETLMFAGRFFVECQINLEGGAVIKSVTKSLVMQESIFTEIVNGNAAENIPEFDTVKIGIDTVVEVTKNDKDLQTEGMTQEQIETIVKSFLLANKEMLKGTDGADGKDGADGRNGADGKDGRNGVDGKDGVSPTVTVAKNNKVATISITDKNGVHDFSISDGADGEKGSDGASGKDGINGKDGKDGINGKDGKDGVNGINGTDGKTGEIMNVYLHVQADQSWKPDRSLADILKAISEGKEVVVRFHLMEWQKKIPTRNAKYPSPYYDIACYLTYHRDTTSNEIKGLSFIGERHTLSSMPTLFLVYIGKASDGTESCSLREVSLDDLANNNKYIVNFVRQEDGTYKADKLSTDILNAINKGKQVSGMFDMGQVIFNIADETTWKMPLQLTAYNVASASCRFHGTYASEDGTIVKDYNVFLQGAHISSTSLYEPERVVFTVKE